MENSNQNGQSKFKVLEKGKTDFNEIFGNLGYTMNKALDLLKKDPVNLILAGAIPLITGAILALILFPLAGSLFGLGLLALLITIITAVASIISTIASIKAVTVIGKGEKINLQSLMTFSFKHLISYVLLAINVLLTIFKGLTKWANSWLAMFYFMENNGEGNKAITSSQEDSNGKTSTIVWGVILVMLVTSIVQSIVNTIWINIFGSISSIISGFGVPLINSIILPITFLNLYILREEIKKNK